MDGTLVPTKVCSVCKRALRYDHFTKRASTKDGLDYRCKTCKAIRASEAYRRHSSRIKERVRNYASANADLIRLKRAEYRRRERDRISRRRKELAPKYREKMAAYFARYRKENRKRLDAQMAEYQKNHREEANRRSRKWNAANPEYLRAAYARYRARLLLAIPKWSNETIIRSIYKQARKMSADTGVKHHVDHIVPLQSHLVCGLHCEGNLQILEGKKNASKSNRHWPDMP